MYQYLCKVKPNPETQKLQRGRAISILPSSPPFLSSISLQFLTYKNSFLSLSMSASPFASLTVLRSVTLSLTHYHPSRCFFRRIVPDILFCPPIPLEKNAHGRKCIRLSCSTFVEQLESEPLSTSESAEQLEFYNGSELQELDFEKSLASIDLKHLGTPVLEVQDLDELPELWRRSKLAWLCKELPGHKPGTLVRVLNAQRKWVRQDDATYLAVHCMRIRENETGFRVYKWMMQQRWYRFDFSLATKLADYLGKGRKFSKCREVFDDIINQGHIPSESTFHILIVAYLSAPISGCLEEACGIYNRMIQLGGYRPRLSLHNSLFKALVSKSGVSSKHYLKQAEFVFHNLATAGLEIHKDIFGGLVWLHSYQDNVDKERIDFLIIEMRRAGFDEGKEVFLSILRACSKEGNLEELESTWLKLSKVDGGVPSQAFVYKMEAYAKVGSPLKCLEIFREMQRLSSLTSVVAYHKIIEILCKAQEVELAESIMMDLIESNLKPIMPSFIDLMNMYFNLSLHDKLEATFSRCLEKCTPNRTVYSIFLDSLVRVGRLDRAEEIFNEMQTSGTIGISARSCNIILSGYLSSGNHVKAEKIYNMMRQKKYDVDPPLMDKIDNLSNLSRKEVQKPISLKLSQEQREILVGMMLGGLEVESDEERKNHRILFSFNENSDIHQILRRHIYEQYHEWLHPSSKLSNADENIPYVYCTVSHSYFGFYADQFWPQSRPTVPKLIHRWLSPRALAYWYMFGAHRSSSGDILLKLKGSREGVEKVVKTFKEKSIDCKVKSKGRVYWIAFIGSNSSLLWKLIEPYILDCLKDILRPDDLNLEDELLATQNFNFDSSADSSEEASEDIDNRNA